MNKSELHAGYEFEDGMFSRMRSWVDVASWVRLGRVPRILASPINVGLVVLACAVTESIVSLFVDIALCPPWNGTSQSYAVVPTDQIESLGLLRTILLFALLVCLWTPVIQFVGRGGAALAAGQTLPAAGETMRLVGSRLWKSYLVPLIPWICVAAFAVALLVIRLPSLALDASWLAVVTGGILGVAVIPVGVLAFGALFAIPLGLTAMVCEPDPDPIDSLSRGYEYLFRRPLSLVWYLAIACLLILCARLMLGGVGWASSLIANAIVSVGPTDNLQIVAAIKVIETIIAAWQITLFLGLLGGIYLLLRSDAGGQEAEDFWSPPTGPSQPLPELPMEAFES